MALRKRLDPDVPGTSQPAHCRYEGDGERCGAEAHNWIELTTDVMGKDVHVKLPVCDEHISKLTSGTEGLNLHASD